MSGRPYRLRASCSERFEKQDGLPIIKFSLKFFEEEAKYKVIYGQDPLKESGFACI
jgi:hypothetical protein